MSGLGKLHFLVGLPASGKSTFAGKLSEKTNSVILSSDKLREELYGDVNDQTDHNFIFNELYKRANELLSNGVNVIVDATNTNRKKRIHAINHVLMADKKIAYYLNTRLYECYENDFKRSRRVGRKVINKMYKNMQIPVENEGWDQISFISNDNRYLLDEKEHLENVIRSNIDHDSLFSSFPMIPEFSRIYEMPHDSMYHSFSVSRHTYYVYDYIKNTSYSLILLWASLFHDLGKDFCKSFINFKGEEKRYASFIGHEHVSSQLAAYYLDKLGYDEQFIKDVSALCQFHMYPMNSGEKKMKQVQKLLGDNLYDKLMLLHEADKQAK